MFAWEPNGSLAFGSQDASRNTALESPMEQWSVAKAGCYFYYILSSLGLLTLLLL